MNFGYLGVLWPSGGRVFSAGPLFGLSDVLGWSPEGGLDVGDVCVVGKDIWGMGSPLSSGAGTVSLPLGVLSPLPWMLTPPQLLWVSTPSLSPWVSILSPSSWVMLMSVLGFSRGMGGVDGGVDVKGVDVGGVDVGGVDIGGMDVGGVDVGGVDVGGVSISSVGVGGVGVGGAGCVGIGDFGAINIGPSGAGVFVTEGTAVLMVGMVGVVLGSGLVVKPRLFTDHRCSSSMPAGHENEYNKKG